MANALNTYLDKNTPVKATPQTEKAAKGQKRNNAGGYSFKVDDVQRLTRFLVLGTEGGTYYVSEQDLTRKNVDFIEKMIAKDERKVVDTLVDVSVNARAPKNTYALFVLALVFAKGTDKVYASDALLKVARTATHLFEFVSFLKKMGGLGRAKQRAIANWYLSKTPDQVAYQAVKYRSRAGFTHADLFKLSHPVGFDKNVGNFILGKEYGEVPAIVTGFKMAQSAKNVDFAMGVIDEFKGISWEMFPTSFHKEPDFWKALFYAGMGQTALVRNVTRFAKLGLLSDVKFAGDFAKALADEAAIEKGRVHPVQYLNALFAYKEGVYGKSPYGYGSGYRDKNWTVNAKVAGALEKGFYAAFKNVVPSGKRTMISLDVSGSMQSPVGGLPGLSCREASAAMAMVTLRTEDYVVINGFTSGRGTSSGYGWGRNGVLTELSISDTDSLGDAIQKVSGLPFGGTDCSLPMLHALKNKIEIDTFIIYTDNETWAGSMHPHEALAKYRKEMGIDAKLIVVGMTGTPFTIADPNDSGMLDVVGFDSAAPGVMADFSAGRL